VTAAEESTSPHRDAPSPGELLDLHRGEYVRRYHDADRGRLRRLVPRMALDRDQVVLDVGCGNGLLLDLIHERVGAYHGVDFSDEFVATAKERQHRAGIRNAEFHCVSVIDYCSERPAAFDRAFALDFTEHVPDRDLLPIAAALRDSLRPGGILYVHTPDGDFFLEALRNRGVLRQQPQHVAVRNAAQYRALFARAGFSEVRVHHLPHYLGLLAWLRFFTWIPWLGRHLRARLFLECVA